MDLKATPDKHTVFLFNMMGVQNEVEVSSIYLFVNTIYAFIWFSIFNFSYLF